MNRPIVLMILDGWGWREEREGNATIQASTPNFDRLLAKYPHAFLQTSGEDVGLPAGTMGNSEVGHLNIGAGRIVYQDLTRISKSIHEGEFFKNQSLLNCCQEVVSKRSSLHVMGLCSDVGVHAHLDHLDALLDVARAQGVERVYVHAITDGRDSSPSSGKAYLDRVQKKVEQVGNAKIASVSGRFYMMDRDRRWDRTEKAWQALTLASGAKASSAAQAIENAYAQGVTDEFIEPTVICENDQPVATLQDGDALIFFNYRADRARQIVQALGLSKFDSFQRKVFPQLSNLLCMTKYEKDYPFPVMFPKQHHKNILGAVLAEHKLKQLRIAETEKYAHVTFFFNGGEDVKFKGEDQVLIPSPRDVATYDQKPEMSAEALTCECLKRIESSHYDVIVINFANPDMVGHTGSLPAAIKAVEKVDDCMGRIVKAVLAKSGELIITSDHGNCEELIDENSGPFTSHTLNPVPVIYVADRANSAVLQNGTLADLAPSLLKLLDISQPDEMSGKSLIDV